MTKPATVHVHLQEGFEAEPVRVSIDDRVVLDAPQVRTKPQIGLAHTLEADTTAAHIVVHIELGRRHTARRVEVDPLRTPWVGVSVGENGEVQVRTQSEPFGYL